MPLPRTRLKICRKTTCAIKPASSTCRHRGRAPSHSPAGRSELLEQGCAGLLRCTQTLQAEFARLCCFRRLSRRPQRDGLPHVERRALYERLERLRQATASAEVAVLRRTATQSTDEQERSVNWTWHEVVGVRSTPGVRPLAISAEWVGGGCLRAPEPLIFRNYCHKFGIVLRRYPWCPSTIVS